MNIGSVFRGLLGDVKAGEAKKLDMQPGQVVRGVVLKVSEDGDEAVLQIQGSQVRAKLETPLQPGQTATFQVQPASSSGMTVLKPLNDAANMPQQTVALTDVLESVGLPDTAQNRELIQAMQKNGVPLTSENAASLQEALSKQSGNVQLGTFVQAAAVAFQRGLPLTAESINGLRQTMFGPPLNDLLSSLEQELEAVLKQQGQGTPTDRSVGEATIKSADRTSASPTGTSSVMIADGQEGQTLTLSKEPSGSAAAKQAETGQQATGGKELLKGTQAANLAATVSEASVLATDSDTPAGSTAYAANGTASKEPEAVNGRGATVVLDAGANAPESDAADALNGSRTKVEQPQQATAAGMQFKDADGAPSPATAEPAGAKSALNVVMADRPSAQSAAGSAPPSAEGNAATLEAPIQRLRLLLQELRAAVPPELSTAAPDQSKGEVAQPAAGASRTADAAASQPTATSTKISPMEDPWVGRVLKLLGAEHEQQVHRSTAQLAQGTAARTEPPEGVPQTLPGLAATADDSVSAAADTVKGALLQLMSSDDLPPALKEAAQQVVQHLTGQQLLLNTDRTAPFAQVHMFIPFIGPDGRETATIQIQSRRGKRGELDASNCRLWFDLDMKGLGPTLVDVQVVDRIVSLKLHNDQEWAASLLTSGRESIRTALESLGYQLLTLRTEPMPIRTEQSSSVSSEVQSYVPQPYKGVDLKI
ncbi:DNA ligase [Paenibacillus polymyxa]|uniref:DNA ligase 1 n=1 Tax=Paenibacillus polymyxa TaxID=1406 RepID=A0A378XYR0_PAEPO|nr:DNA ligase 1 [Paenibacillus polymyxa]MBE7898215.1 DNA ligase [Paenibacillus polymyxa]MBG9763394.1 DNA ligase [Paenibacillus polymyxa]MCC3258042.1 DNA ligase [Paenibacillus polymyxa]QPK55695.1 DNA ligase [Paenibacillus polymyxa]QPK60782.1 DNA ligase [Paenibacillus polymyxa]